MKNKTLLIPYLVLTLAISACASSGANHTPIIDAPKTAQYNTDLEDCRTLAKQKKIVDDKTTVAAGLGAAIGALRGADNRYRRKSSSDRVFAGALIGATIGGGAGVYGGYKQQENILLNCMAGRGYRVLG